MYIITGVVLITVVAFLVGCDGCDSSALSCATPANSCADVFCDIKCGSGYYWIKTARKSAKPAKRVYCRKDHYYCGEGVWMRVALIDTNKKFFTCPGGTEPMVVNKRQYCRSPTAGGCASIHFDSMGHTYSEVCGVVRGYQYYTADAFGYQLSRQLSSVDQNYLDGFSFTYGSRPRKHLFSYAVGYNEDNSIVSCPCSPGGGFAPPDFVGNDYYCSTAVSGNNSPPKTLATSDPLFDGVGMCGGTCCDNLNQPWFKKAVLPQTSDDLEMRVCVDQPLTDEAVAFNRVELYIRVD